MTRQLTLYKRAHRHGLVITSMLKVIWKQENRAVLLLKVPLGYNGASQFLPQNYRLVSCE